MSPLELCAAVDIDRPAAVVWDVVSDYRLDPRWRRGVEAMVPDPFGPVVSTTTTHEVLRLAGRTYRSDGLVVALDPGRSFAWRTVSGASASGARTVEEIDGHRSRVVLDLRVVPTGSERLMAPVLRRMLARTLRTDLDRLARTIDELTVARTSS